VTNSPDEVQEPLTEEKGEVVPLAEDSPPSEGIPDPQEDVKVEGSSGEAPAGPENAEEPEESVPLPNDSPEAEEPLVEATPPSDDSRKETEAEEAPKDVEESSVPVAEIAAGAAAIGVIGMIAANLDSEKIANRDIVEEPKELDDIAEKEGSPDAPPSPKSEKDKRSSRHRSSRHSTHSSRHSSSKEKDSPSEESRRPHSYRKRRDSDTSFKNLIIPTSSKKPDRHDSGYSQGSGGSHKKQRTPEEQAAHDKRKAEHRAAKAKVAESESAVVDGHAEASGRATEAPRRMSSRRHSHSHSSKEGSDKKLLDTIRRGESIVKSPFIVTKDQPHIKEEVREVKKPIMERLRFSIDGERPSNATRIEKGRVHSHRDRGSRHSRERKTDDRHKKERDEKEKYRVEKEREATRMRRETEKQMVIARENVAEEARRKREKDDEERRIRREERRKRREAEERAAEEGKGKEREHERTHTSSRKPRSDKSKDGERSDRHRERGRERETSKEDKSALKTLWSSAKKVFG
jgi:hypothetical protein